MISQPISRKNLLKKTSFEFQLCLNEENIVKIALAKQEGKEKGGSEFFQNFVIIFKPH